MQHWRSGTKEMFIFIKQYWKIKSCRTITHSGNFCRRIEKLLPNHHEAVRKVKAEEDNSSGSSCHIGSAIKSYFIQVYFIYEKQNNHLTFMLTLSSVNFGKNCMHSEYSLESKFPISIMYLLSKIRLGIWEFRPQLIETIKF